MFFPFFQIEIHWIYIEIIEDTKSSLSAHSLSLSEHKSVQLTKFIFLLQKRS